MIHVHVDCISSPADRRQQKYCPEKADMINASQGYTYLNLQIYTDIKLQSMSQGPPSLTPTPMYVQTRYLKRGHFIQLNLLNLFEELKESTNQIITASREAR